MNKRGWIRILEATFAVLIVSGTMLAVYSGKNEGSRSSAIMESSSTIQQQILDDIESNSSLRLAALNTISNLPTDTNYEKLNSFVNSEIPNDTGYLLLVCKLSLPIGFCNMDSKTFIATMDRDVSVQTIIISAEIGNGTDAVYAPKNIRIFTWKGKLPKDFCKDSCIANSSTTDCSSDHTKVIEEKCLLNQTSDCLELQKSSDHPCVNGQSCVNGVCVGSSNYKLVCKDPTTRTAYTSGCVYNYDDECNNYDYGHRIGGCGFPFHNKDKYECWNYTKITTGCSANPVCPNGDIQYKKTACSVPSCVVTSWAPSPSTKCKGKSFQQTSNCLTTRTKTGTKDCIAKLKASYDFTATAVQATKTTYYFTSKISETNGVGVTIKSRQKCYKSSCHIDWCDPIKKDISLLYGTDHISPNGHISNPTNYIGVNKGCTATMTETFKGIDDNGHNVQASYSFTKTA